MANKICTLGRLKNHKVDRLLMGFYLVKKTFPLKMVHKLENIIHGDDQFLEFKVANLLISDNLIRLI